MKKEILIFFFCFISLSLMIHMDHWIQHPIEHLYNLTKDARPYHPLLFTMILYSFIAFLRFIYYSIVKLFRLKL